MKNEVIAQMVLTHIVPKPLQKKVAIKAHEKGKDVVAYVVDLIKKDLKE